MSPRSRDARWRRKPMPRAIDGAPKACAVSQRSMAIVKNRERLERIANARVGGRLHLLRLRPPKAGEWDSCNRRSRDCRLFHLYARHRLPCFCAPARARLKASFPNPPEARCAPRSQIGRAHCSPRKLAKRVCKPCWRSMRPGKIS